MPRKTPRQADEPALEAAADELARLAADPNLISGIYNYCDRWCERCPQTARCLNFKMGQARDARRGRSVPNDLVNGEFWEELGKSLALALHVVRKEAGKQGIDLDSTEISTAIEVQERTRRRRAVREGATLRTAAAAYGESARALLARLPVELRATEEALHTQARLSAGDPHGAAADIGDALEVVSWYLFFVEVKLARAVGSRVDEKEDGDDGFPRDSDGSAKLALIAIDRSLAAWMRLRGHLDGEQDAILGLLMQLEHLRRTTENEFLEARAFKRAGFD